MGQKIEAFMNWLRMSGFAPRVQHWLAGDGRATPRALSTSPHPHINWSRNSQIAIVVCLGVTSCKPSGEPEWPYDAQPVRTAKFEPQVPAPATATVAGEASAASTAGAAPAGFDAPYGAAAPEQGSDAAKMPPTLELGSEGLVAHSGAAPEAPPQEPPLPQPTEPVPQAEGEPTELPSAPTELAALDALDEILAAPREPGVPTSDLAPTIQPAAGEPDPGEPSPAEASAAQGFGQLIGHAFTATTEEGTDEWSFRANGFFDFKRVLAGGETISRTGTWQASTGEFSTNYKEIRNFVDPDTGEARLGTTLGGQTHTWKMEGEGGGVVIDGVSLSRVR